MDEPIDIETGWEFCADIPIDICGLDLAAAGIEVLAATGALLFLKEEVAIYGEVFMPVMETAWLPKSWVFLIWTWAASDLSVSLWSICVVLKV